MNSFSKYDLKLRGASKKNDVTGKGGKNKGPDKFINKMIICVVILTAIVFLKMSSSSVATKITDKIAYFLDAQTDFISMAENVGNFVNRTVAKIMGNETVSLPVDNKVYGFVLPVDECTFPSEQFDASVSPSIVITTEEGASVYACSEGIIDNIMTNSDGTKRITLKISDMLVVVYDNVGAVYVNENDTVSKKAMIASLPEGSANLSFTVWLNGSAADPAGFFDTSINHNNE